MRALLFVMLSALLYAGEAPLTVAVTMAPELESGPVDGRLLLLISTDGNDEPRFQITGNLATQQVFGIDVDNWRPGQAAVFDDQVFGHPLPSLAAIPPGDYYVQALLHRYETFTRADGHVVKLPMDRGEGQQWNRAPGNLFSAPQKLRIDPTAHETVEIVIGHRIPPIADPPETKYLKHVKIKNERLSEFWGRPMYLGAHVLLPHGWHENPEARYPLVIMHGHFSHTFWGWRETPPDPDLEPVYSTRFGVEGYNRIVEQEAWDFYQHWTSDATPRMIIIEIQHPNPYYDDSYAVNSANLGPYGDAITYDLIPYIEKEFRGIGEGWARFLYGGSTGGWEALAAQVFYPDEYNGCFAACPDPIDFRAYETVNIYDDDNAYYREGPWMRVARPDHRDWLGHISSTVESSNHQELVLGENSRSGRQWDIWQAVYGPVGEDGYPQPIWDKRTGEIDSAVADYWRENYDLRYILERDWETLGPKLAGKIHIYVGDMDNYYLNNAVYLMEEFLESTRDPYYAGEVAYGDRDEHCWNGDPDLPNHISRLRYHRMYVDRIMARIAESAPPGADTTSWRY